MGPSVWVFNVLTIPRTGFIARLAIAFGGDIHDRDARGFGTGSSDYGNYRGGGTQSERRRVPGLRSMAGVVQ